ncbi:MAG: hypothetical protein H0V82_00305 [Candidatus Protochlamydia sp.]|nr:hypothetical protein [Candidatus Protochlamydia sp.]
MNSLSLYEFQINDNYSSPYFGATLGAKDQNGRKFDVVYVRIDEKNGKPQIIDNYPNGLRYYLSECNSMMIPDFKTLLEKNLVLLYNEDQSGILAFYGIEKYGKIKKNSQFFGKIVLRNNYSVSDFNDPNGTRVYNNSFTMMDKKTSEYIKKTLLNIAWMCNNVTNNISENQYKSIAKSIPLPKQQTTQPLLSQTTNTPSQTTSVPSRSKTLPTPPPKLSSSISSSITISGYTNSFKSLGDFKGNNFDKDCETPPDQLIKTAIELAKKEGFTKFALSNSFKKNIEVYPEPYSSKTNAIYHKVKVDFFIDASNDYGKTCQLILQRQFFTCYSDKTIVIQKITDTANKILDSF